LVFEAWGDTMCFCFFGSMRGYRHVDGHEE
jgi:hypothetical protein